MVFFFFFFFGGGSEILFKNHKKLENICNEHISRCIGIFSIFPSGVLILIYTDSKGQYFVALIVSFAQK